LRLRKYVKQGKPAADGEHRYIDTAEFWKDQYTKIHSEKQKLEVQLAQLEVLTEQDRSGGRAAIFELCSLSTAVGHQCERPFSDAGFTSSNYSDTRAKIRVNNSQIYHYSNRL
jgi:hypothetical protein